MKKGTAIPKRPTRAKLRRVQRKLYSRFSRAELHSSMNRFLLASIPPPIFLSLQSFFVLHSAIFYVFSLQGSRWYRFVMLPIYKPTVWLRGLPCSERIFATFWLQRQGCSCNSVNSPVPFGTKRYKILIWK